MALRSERLGRHFTRGIDTAESALTDLVGTTAGEARAAARKSSAWLAKKERTAERTRKELARGLKSRKQSIAAAATAADRFVKHRSWTALGLAAAAAAVIGVMMARRQ